MILEYLLFFKDLLFIYLLVRPKVDISVEPDRIKEGKSVNLTCKVEAGRPEPQITWLKNTTLKGNSLSLFFTEITKEDEGLYTCRANNEAGVSTKDVNISVKVPPRIKEFRNLTIAFNSPFKEECYLGGDPKVSVNWTKDAVLISKNNTLVIRQVTLKYKGNYECTAKNDYGKEKSSFWIDVTVSSTNFCPDQEQAIQMEPLNAEVDEWEVAVNRVLLQDVIGRGAFGAVWRALLSSPNGQPGNRTVAAKCFTRKPPSICSIDTYVDLRAMALPDQEEAIQMEPLNAEVDEWEVAVNRVLLQDVIGRGAFGAVWRALLSSPNGQPGNRTVAAKCFT
ncbi:neural cell adhesion molecule 2-like, partial [Pocillopora damicornis]|uniref:neural cell adhesion molecule 2-like n=1 Tax=Pocillopora damicornis TaxID=46731 RepID=UPI000F559924